jgi:hypothetical protein
MAHLFTSQLQKKLLRRHNQPKQTDTHIHLLSLTKPMRQQ